MAMRLVWACITRPESYNEAGCDYVTK